MNRRSFLWRISVAGAGAAHLVWGPRIGLRAEELRRRRMACILLFMRGAPSQFETFDPKPGTETGGPTKAIETAVSGIRIAEGWEPLGAQMKDISLVRSVTNNKEGNHDRAVYQLHTGYVRSGTAAHPNFGSIASAELGDPEFDLPHFVNVGNRTGVVGSGFLGAAHAPFVVRAEEPPRNVALPSGVTAARFEKRHALLEGLESDFAEEAGKSLIRDHQSLSRSGKRMVLSPRMKAFDLTEETDAVRDSYGRNEFGQGCLLARRLVEQGVTFVEVETGTWDTHADNFNLVRKLAGSVAPAFATLVADLKNRGMLETTLVLWMGEFGRTPRINAKAGRDHHPLSFNMALAGGGIQGGRVVGATNEKGTEVADRPVTVPDLFCTFSKSLGIDPRKENTSRLGRPIQIVDGGGPIDELF